VATAIATHGPLDCAANVAGTHAALGARTAEVSAVDFDRQLAVNLRGMWLCVRAELGSMLNSDGGAIVNVSSVNGLTPADQAAPYAAAKHGILGLTKTAAVEYAKEGIRVNAVAPGLVDTPLTAPMWDTFGVDRATAEPELLASIPAGRMASAQEVATVIAWLCTEAPSYLTGATLVIDGGLVIRG
jgi:NAD(P)-dependent dehydrogenase (short-subunit alcohol dehydrogenase family)